MNTLKRIFLVLKNKYLIAIIVFAVIMLFFDHNNIFEQIDRKKQLNELLASKKFYQQQIEQTKKELADLQNNPAALEKYARENFYMKRDNEDLFVIEKNETGVKK